MRDHRVTSRTQEVNLGTRFITHGTECAQKGRPRTMAVTKDLPSLQRAASGPIEGRDPHAVGDPRGSSHAGWFQA